MSLHHEKRALSPGGGRATRAERARSEPMAVVPVGDGSYDVVTEGDRVYTVDLPERRCTCPDARIRGARCKHLRRVAIDVTEGRVPAPGERAARCRVCGRAVHVPEDDDDPVYCDDDTLRPGEYAVDREHGTLVVVARTTDRRADEVDLGDGHTVASYPGNEASPDRDAVVEVCYPLPAGLDAEAVQARTVRRYSFPRSRLRRAGDVDGLRRN